MLVIKNLHPGQLHHFGQSVLDTHRDKVRTLEAAAHIWVRCIYDALLDENKSRVFALVRIFRISSYAQLPPDVQAQVNPHDEQWLTLVATYGDQPAWCNRQLSQSHRCIPRASAHESPMLNAVFNQLDLFWKLEMSNTGLPLKTLNKHITRYFYVPEASSSPYIVAQEDFVKPYQIKSVIGLGSQFVSGSPAILIGFSKAYINEQAAQLLAELAPYVFTLLSNKNMIWD